MAPFTQTTVLAVAALASATNNTLVESAPRGNHPLRRVHGPKPITDATFDDDDDLYYPGRDLQEIVLDLAPTSLEPSAAPSDEVKKSKSSSSKSGKKMRGKSSSSSKSSKSKKKSPKGADDFATYPSDAPSMVPSTVPPPVQSTEPSFFVAQNEVVAEDDKGTGKNNQKVPVSTIVAAASAVAVVGAAAAVGGYHHFKKVRAIQPGS
jgi:hypothetical protein